MSSGRSRQPGSASRRQTRLDSVISRHATHRVGHAPVRHVERHQAAEPCRCLLRTRRDRDRSQRREPEGFLGAARRPCRLRRSACTAAATTGGRSPTSRSTTSPTDVRERYLEEFRNIVFQLDAHRPWVMKEPRLCLLLPVLRPVLEAPVYVHVTREPLEIAESLAARNGFPVAGRTRVVGGVHRQRVRGGRLRTERDRRRTAISCAIPSATTTRLIEQLAELEVQGLRTPDRARGRRRSSSAICTGSGVSASDRERLPERAASRLGRVGDDLRLPSTSGRRRRCHRAQPRHCGRSRSARTAWPSSKPRSKRSRPRTASCRDAADQVEDDRTATDQPA